MEILVTRAAGFIGAALSQRRLDRSNEVVGVDNLNDYCDVRLKMARPAGPNPDWDGDSPDSGTRYAPYRLYNIGNNNAVELGRYIEVLEECLGRKARQNLLPLQPGDVPDTFADVHDLVRDLDYRPDTPIEVGVRRFVDWYKSYYKLQ
jgi:nucleoside-diphosphate-sugar epimerase